MVNLCVLCDGNDNCRFRARTTGIGKFHEWPTQRHGDSESDAQWLVFYWEELTKVTAHAAEVIVMGQQTRQSGMALKEKKLQLKQQHEQLDDNDQKIHN